MTTNWTPGEFGEDPFRNDQEGDTTALAPEVTKWFDEVVNEELARSAIDNLFDGHEDERLTRAMLDAAEKVLTGACASIAFGDQPDDFHLGTLHELEPHDDEDERDRIPREVVEKMLAGVRIAKVVVKEGKLMLLIKLRTEREPGDAEDK